MNPVLLSALLGGAATALVHTLLQSFREGEAIEAVVGLAYLHLLAVRHDRLPPEAQPARVQQAEDPATAVAEAVAALEASGEFQSDGQLLRALGLPEKAAALKAATLRGLIDAVALDGASDDHLARVEETLSASMTGPGRAPDGEYFTPPRAVELVARLLDAPPGSRVYDPTCGTASLLLGVAGRAAASGGEPPHLFGQDLNPTAVALSRVRCHLRGLPAEIALGDVLSAPAHAADGQLAQFPYVVGNPPRGVRLDRGGLESDPYGRFGDGLVRGPNADAAFLLHALASLAPGGRAVVTVGPGVLQASWAKDLRQRLVEEDLVEAVVALPVSFFRGLAVPPAVLVLSRAKPEERRGRITMVEAEVGDTGDAAFVDRVAEAAGRHHHRPGLSAVPTAAQVATNGYDLSPVGYVALIEVERFMGGRGRRVPLSDLAEVVPTRQVQMSEDGDDLVVKARDLRDRVLDPDTLDRVAVEGDPSVFTRLQSGDVVLQEVGLRPRAAVVPSGAAGAIAHKTVIVLRPTAGSPAAAQYLADLVNSDLGQTLLKFASSWMGPHRRIQASRLSDLAVPVPDDTVLAFLTDVRDAEADLAARVASARALRDQLFTLDDPERFDAQVRHLRADAEVLSRGLAEIDTPAYRVRNFYPFPVAFRYRELDGIVGVRARYDAVFEVAEKTVAFVACLGLALANREGALNDDERTYAAELWRSNMTAGKWQDLAYRMAKALRKHEQSLGAGDAPSPAASDYAAMWFRGKGTKTSAVYDATKRFIEPRNAKAHHRGPVTDSDYERIADDYTRVLDVIVEGLGWTVSYPLRLVVRSDPRWSPSGAPATYDVLTSLYTGDHPGLRQEVIETTVPLVPGHLYLDVGDGTPLSLYPLVTAHECPACKRRETYVADYWNGQGEARLLSYERNGEDHLLPVGSDASCQIADDLGKWFKGGG